MEKAPFKAKILVLLELGRYANYPLRPVQVAGLFEVGSEKAANALRELKKRRFVTKHKYTAHTDEKAVAYMIAKPYLELWLMSLPDKWQREWFPGLEFFSETAIEASKAYRKLYKYRSTGLEFAVREIETGVDKVKKLLEKSKGLPKRKKSPLFSTGLDRCKSTKAPKLTTKLSPTEIPTFATPTEKPGTFIKYYLYRKLLLEKNSFKNVPQFFRALESTLPEIEIFKSLGLPVGDPADLKICKSSGPSTEELASLKIISLGDAILGSSTDNPSGLQTLDLAGKQTSQSSSLKIKSLGETTCDPSSLQTLEPAGKTTNQPSGLHSLSSTGLLAKESADSKPMTRQPRKRTIFSVGKPSVSDPADPSASKPAVSASATLKPTSPSVVDSSTQPVPSLIKTRPCDREGFKPCSPPPEETPERKFWDKAVKRAEKNSEIRNQPSNKKKIKDILEKGMIAQQSMHPKYWHLDPDERTEEFIEARRRVTKTLHGDSYKHKGQYFSIDVQRKIDLELARVRTDYNGLRYDDYLTAIYEYYAVKHPGNQVPPDRELGSSKWIMEVLPSYKSTIWKSEFMLTREDLEETGMPELLPENFCSTKEPKETYNRQCRLYEEHVLPECERLARTNRESLQQWVDSAIAKGILSKEWAESYGEHHDEANLKGYRYSGKVSLDEGRKAYWSEGAEKGPWNSYDTPRKALNHDEIAK